MTTNENTDPSRLWGPAALDYSRDARRKLQARVAPVRQRWIDANRYYYDAVKRVLRFIIEPGARVLNVRCQTGHLLHSVAPSHGVGVDISQEMVDVAARQHPQYRFACADPEAVELSETFDYILFNDVSDTVDVQAAFTRLAPLCEPHTRLVVFGYNRLWQNVVDLAARLGWKMPSEDLSWLSEHDLRGLLRLSGFEVVSVYRIVLAPKWIPLVSEFLNRVVARLPGVSRLCMNYFIVARPLAAPVDPASVRVSVIIPCRNEEGNVRPAVERLPQLGRETEVIFCDDKSTDGTAAEVRRMQQMYPERIIRLVDGPGINKAENVRTGFRAATGDLVMILDGDLAVMPEELPYFVRALTDRSGEFINGSRLVYPMPRAAMKFANSLGNKAFSMLFSYLLDRPIKDTLCGTKALWRRDWERIDRRLWGQWGVLDRWGDYELLFGARRLQLAIVDLPVHYQERVYGVTKMTRVFANGLHMLRMCGAAWLRLKVGY
jgi:hypothetical protein